MSRNNSSISYNELRDLGYYVPEEAAGKSFTVWSNGEVCTSGTIGVNIDLEEEDMYYLNQVWELEFFDI